MPRKLSEYDVEVPEPVWGNHFYKGVLHMVAGLPDEGKSGITIKVAADLTRKRKHVLYIASEDGIEDTIHPRVLKAGGDTDRLHVEQDWMFPDDQDALRAYVKRHRIAMVIIDPIQNSVSVTMGRDRAERTFAKPLFDLAREMKIPIVVTHHLIKSLNPKQHPMNAIGGASGGLRGQCRLIYIVGRHPDNADERVMFKAKNNVVEDPPKLLFEIDVDEYTGTKNTKRVGTAPFFILRGECNEIPNSAVMEASQTRDGAPKKATKTEEVAEWLSRYLFLAPNNCAAKNDIEEDAKQHGFTAKSLRNAREAMDLVVTQQGKQDGTSGRGPAIWSLPKELVEIMREQDQRDE
jgi:hypothetical protein